MVDERRNPSAAACLFQKIKQAGSVIQMRLKHLEDRQTVMHFHVPLVFALIAGVILPGCRRPNHKHSFDNSFHTTQAAINWTCVFSGGKEEKNQSLFLRGL